MIKFFGGRGQGKRYNPMLDDPVFICDKCRVLFAVKYLAPFQIMHCPQCGHPTTAPTTLRKKYLECNWEEEG